jgi:hypothetical protein
MKDVVFSHTTQLIVQLLSYTSVVVVTYEYMFKSYKTILKVLLPTVAFHSQ